MSSRGRPGRPPRGKPPRRSGREGRRGPPRPRPKRPPKPPRKPEAHSTPPAGTGASDSTWVFGPARLVETLESIPAQVRRVLVRTGRLERRHEALLKIARARGAPVSRVPNRALDRIAAGARHQGAAAEISPVPWLRLPEVLAADPPPDLLLLLDGVEDPRNFGALVRTADGAGVAAVLVPGRGAAPPSAAAMAASSGTLARMRLARVRSARSALRVLGPAGLCRVGMSPRARVPWHVHDWTRPTVLVVGAEGRGLGAAVANECDVLLALPQLGSGRSLNVSVAAGVVLYEAVRQRMVAARPLPGIAVDGAREANL